MANNINKTDIIFLIGFMGAGKTTVGKILSYKLKRPFLDTDSIIEKNSNMTIPDIFSQHGEEYFRELERKALMEVISKGPCVVSTGGGLVTYKDNLDIMKEKGSVVAIMASKQELVRRLTSSHINRPLLSGSDDLDAKTDTLMHKRAYYYIKADVMINSNGISPDEVSKKIIAELKIDLQQKN